MLPWLIDLGLGVVDLGLAATAVALVIEGLPGAAARRSRRRPAEPGAPDDDGTDAGPSAGSSADAT